MNTAVLRLPIFPRYRLVVLLLVLADIVSIVLSATFALLLRFDGIPLSVTYSQYVVSHIGSFIMVVGLYLAVFWAFHLYRCVWRYASLETLWGVFYSNCVGIVGLIVIQSLVDGHTFPRSVIFMIWGLNIALTGGTRIALRMLSTKYQNRRLSARADSQNTDVKRVIIMSDDQNGAQVLRAIREDPSLAYQVIGILDDDPSTWGVYISNVKVLGPLDHLKQIIAEEVVDVVIAALSDISSEKVREIIIECRKRRLPVKMVTTLGDVFSSKNSLRLVDFSVEDLIQRPRASTKIADIGGYLSGKRVLVTGAGGSIGSELCRQIASLNPASLILLGHGENSIHRIHRELLNDHGEMADRIYYAIASVSQQHRIDQVLELYRPQIVFHAAAHKHVPMMEVNEQEAVNNNILGTYCVADSCGRFNVERFVLISTDKAADPCCIMGYTKRFCEELLRAETSLWPGTAYMTVRFGNVLGSRGSVIPIFCDQIKRGGPVTVTHPEMTRYFMTIPEAVQLVIQAGAVGKSDELYLLDMGRPIKILDLAKDTIRMHGLIPDMDIDIKFTGIRNGEKLHEQLISANEQVEQTSMDGLIKVRRTESRPPSDTIAVIKRLEYMAQAGTADEVRRGLVRAVQESYDRKPEYATSCADLEAELMDETEEESAEAGRS